MVLVGFASKFCQCKNGWVGELFFFLFFSFFFSQLCGSLKIVWKHGSMAARKHGKVRKHESDDLFFLFRYIVWKQWKHGSLEAWESQEA